jgi:glycosyltransferase involved in cell wall biosynthesis
MLPEARRLYTISQNVSTRLRKFNGLHAEPLYHPPALWNVLEAESYDRFIFYPSRITPIKRQRLIVEAARYFDNGVRVILAGKDDSGELEHIRRIIHKHNLEDRIVLPGFLTEEEKLDLYARCGAVYFGGYDEDYGYIPLEGMFASKPVITHSDAGGALEFVRDGENGRVTPPDPERLAEAVNHLFSKPEVLPELGRRGRETMRRKQVSWDFVLDHLLEPARG